MTTVILIVIAGISYFLGGLNGAIISSKYLFKKDVREYGSKNAGLTNFHRTFGSVGSVLVVLVDALKSVAAVLLGGWLLGIVGHSFIGKLFAGFCLMLGHAYPILYEFRGGKSVLCCGVLILLADWRIGLCCLAVFLGLVIFTRFVSLGSMAGVLIFPLGVWILDYGNLAAFLALLCAALLIFKHSANIKRLMAGEENRLEFKKQAKPKF